jgi:hypothetical protein
MRAELITLTPGRRNEVIDRQKAKVRIPVLPIMDVKIDWTTTLELLERAYHIQEFNREWLQNPKYAEYRPPFTTHDERTCVKCLMAALRPFDIGLFGCRSGIQPHRIMLLLCTMTCSMTWMA